MVGRAFLQPLPAHAPPPAPRRPAVSAQTAWLPPRNGEATARAAGTDFSRIPAAARRGLPPPVPRSECRSARPPAMAGPGYLENDAGKGSRNAVRLGDRL